MTANLRRTLLLAALSSLFVLGAPAQISLAGAAEMAVRNSPRVKAAQADVDKAFAVLQETRDVYIPAVSIGAGLGQSYGYSPNPPTLFTFAAQSLVYNGTQYSYIRSARAGYNAARRSLQDVRDSVAEDAAQSFAALDRDKRRIDALLQEGEMTDRLQQIVQDRLTAGVDSEVELTKAKLLSAQIRLSLLQAQDEADNDRTHLAGLIGLAEENLQSIAAMPELPAAQPTTTNLAYESPAEQAAFYNVKAKQAQAAGDSHYLYRPQISLLIQYNRYATFTDSFRQIQARNPNVHIGPDEEVFGVQINLPLFDKGHQAKERESLADARRATADASLLVNTTAENRKRLQHSLRELAARRDVAALEQQLAQGQLEAVQLQTVAAASSANIQVTPKDEQNSRIAERQKYLAVVDANFQLQQAEISLLHQTGGLQPWLQGQTTPAK